MRIPLLIVLLVDLYLSLELAFQTHYLHLLFQDHREEEGLHGPILVLFLPGDFVNFSVVYKKSKH